MADSWDTHYEGEVEGRKIKVKTYSEGGYRVSATQLEDDEGKAYSEGSDTVIIPPTAAGTPIDLDGETIDEVVEQLEQEGFSAEAVNEITGHFPA